MMKSKLHELLSADADGVPTVTITLVVLLISLVTLVSYSQVFVSDFIMLDDNVAIIENPYIQEGLTLQGIKWAFSSTYFSSWQPLTWISYMANISLSGISSRAFHATNLAIHLVNSLLLLFLLSRMTGRFWRSVAVAILFALHPLHVESVAWVSERKDLLSTLFFMLTLLAYHSYITRPQPNRYLFVLVAYALGLCSKPMLVTVPLLLLILDYWPFERLVLQRNREDAAKFSSILSLIAEKIPLFALAAASSLITVAAQQHNGVLAYGKSSLWDDVANALTGYVTYLYLMIFPVNLAVFYPFENDLPLWKPVGACLLLCGLTFLLLTLRKSQPFLISGWLFYLISLLPVIGVLRVGAHSIADRYTYIPLTGVFICIIWSVSESNFFRTHIKSCVAGGLVVIVLMSGLTWVQTGYWRDSEKLFLHAVQVTSNNWMAYNNLAALYLDRREAEKSRYFIDKAIRTNPNNAEAYANLGILYNNSGDFANALIAYQKALTLDPSQPTAHFRLGLLYLAMGDVEKAYDEYRQIQTNSPQKAAMLLDSIRLVSQMR